MNAKPEVYVMRGIHGSYPASFHPSRRYPEYPFEELSPENDVYEAIRNLLATMGLDRSDFGTAYWNPLGEIIGPGQRVVIKPNFVTDYNPIDQDISSLITNGSIIRTLVDYCFIALKGKGQITVCDAPLQSADFGLIRRHAKLDELCDLYKRKAGFQLEIVDLRKVVCNRRNPTEKHEQRGDPNGYAIIDLGNASCHAGRNVDYDRYRVSDYNPTFMPQYHNTINHKYLVSKTLLSADVVINLPKLKTHRKAGLTCALKNMIGMNCIKDALPHHTAGSKEENGDEYLHKNVNKKLSSFLKDFVYRRELSNRVLLRAIWAFRDANYLILKFTAKDPFFAGSWYGNDTLWRTVLDLNRILYYADENGVMKDSVQRRAFILVDAIVAGEREGPLEPSSKQCGVLIAGLNPVAVDCVAAGLMGFDYQKIAQIAKSFFLSEYPLIAVPPDAIVVFDNGTRTNYQGIAERNYDFIPSKGWKPMLRDNGDLSACAEDHGFSDG